MRKKFFVTYVLLILIGIVLTGLITVGFIRINYIENTEYQLISKIELINSFIEEKLNTFSMDQIDFDKYAKEYAKKTYTRVTFIDAKGIVLGDSEILKSDLTKVENHLDRPEIEDALKGKIGKNERYSNTVKIEYVYVALPIKKNDQIKGTTRLAYPLNEIRKVYYKLLEYTCIAIICGIFVSMILGYRYVNNIMRPIKEITKASRRIADGHFKDRVCIQTEDEIGMLANTFNKMTQKLEDSVCELRDKNTKLQSMLTSMKDAVFAVDKHNKIILMNPLAMLLFGIEDEHVYGKNIFEVIKNNDLNSRIKNIILKGQIGKKKIIIDNEEQRTFKVYTNFIKLDIDPNRVIGTMALIEDITEVTKLENIRSEFVANVSHELKTPITSISGFVETLKDGAIEDETVRNRFLDIIDIETQRLTRLIDDLLNLSEIESKRFSYRKEKIITNEIIDEVFIMTEGMTKHKKIEYQIEIEHALPMLQGNKDWFKQMILNLIENAIKYTPDFGNVTVRAYKRLNYIFIIVKDTGIGIPQEDISRLFERFYRVDKARSRKIGGTGLGLAIVKHIVIAFKGNISVNSELGKGSEFIVKIPI